MASIIKIQPPPLHQVIADWKKKCPNLRLGQYFIHTYNFQDDNYPELWETSMPYKLLEEIYIHYQWEM